MSGRVERRARGLYWDAAWKLVEGCTPVSAGCDNCWSEQETEMRAHHPNAVIGERADSVLARAGGFSGRILCREDNLDLPLRTRKPTVWAIWNDIFHEDVPESFIMGVLNRIDNMVADAGGGYGRKIQADHTYLLLTKRAERMADIVGRWYQSFLREGVQPGMDINPGRVWFGVTAENQEQADLRIQHLLRVPGKRFLSIEPMLSAVDLSAYMGRTVVIPGDRIEPYNFGIDAVLLGGESGKNARPMHPDWVRSVSDQCAAAGVPFYFKQWGEWAPRELWNCGRGKAECAIMIDGSPVDDYTAPQDVGGHRFERVGKKAAGRLLDGRTHDALPWDGAQ